MYIEVYPTGSMKKLEYSLIKPRASQQRAYLHLYDIPGVFLGSVFVQPRMKTGLMVNRCEAVVATDNSLNHAAHY